MTTNTFHIFLCLLTMAIILIQFRTVNGDADGATPKTTSKPKNNATSGRLNNTIPGCSGANCTEESNGNIIQNLLNNKPMLMRAFYVLLAVTSIVVVYFMIKAWRIRRRRSKSRKYGLITAKGTDMEMAPLDQDDDDDEDMTVYEMNSRNGRKK